jgi:homoserine/homoserine lactone efflux protein
LDEDSEQIISKSALGANGTREFVYMAPHSFFTFLTIVTIVHVTPGPVFMTLGLQTVNRGLKAGLLTFAGVELAEILLISLVVFGFSSASGPVAQAMHWLSAAGMAYLVYAAICAWLVKPDGQFGPHRFGRNPFLSGFAVTMGDPISLLFYGALFPQFVDWQQPVAPQFLILVGTYFSFAVVFDVSLVLLCAHVHKIKSLKISAHTKKYANAMASSVVAFVMVFAALGSFVGEPKKANAANFNVVAKSDLHPGNHFAHTEAGMAVMLGN